MKFDPTTLPGPLSAKDDMPPELAEVLKKVTDCMALAEPVHKVYRDRWDDIYRLYRSYRKLKEEHATAPDADKGAVILGAQKAWGEELFIPWAFSIIETIVPRLLSQDPKMLVNPRKPAARESADSVQELINAGQAEIGYDLKLQPTARRGLMYGLGVQKTGWNRKARRVLRNVPSATGQGYATEPTEAVLFEGPDVEDVDVYDFFWDPIAANIETARWVLHRTWRDDEYVARMVNEKKWLPLDLEQIKGMKSTTGRDESWAGRDEARGLADSGSTAHKDGLHEVWEYHNGEYVYTILDRTLVVQADESPYFHRELPFQCYRPTIVPGEFVGIGEIEPIAHLQRELNVLRGQRRDNATMALMRAFLYREGRADPRTFKIGPGVGIPIQGDPRSDIVPLEFGDLPASSYREEAAIKQDMELASGISEATAGGSGGGETAGTETATGIQLVQQAANVRIRLKTKNLEREVVRPAGRQFLELYRQHVLEPRDVRVPDEKSAEGYQFMKVGPEQLLDDIDDPIPDAGSTEPDNKLEREQRASVLYQSLSGNPHVNQERLTLHYLKELGVRDADSFIAAIDEIPKVDPRLIGAALQKLGVPEELVIEAIETTLQAQEEADAETQGEPQGDPAMAGQEA